MEPKVPEVFYGIHLILFHLIFGIVAESFDLIPFLQQSVETLQDFA